MDFKDWFQKKISAAKVKEIVTPKGEIDDESKVQRNFESNLHSFKQQVAKGEAATPKKTEPIQDVPVEEEHPIPSATTSSGHDDYILNVLHDLPEQWIGKEMNLHAIADRKDAIWIINRVFQDVERGLLDAQFRVKEFNHMCDLTFTLKIAPGLASFPSAVTAINPVFSFILTDIKSETISRTRKKNL
jgi:hypothetical protein